MNILIYGAGSVGLGLASCLLKSNHNLHIIARPDTVSALKESGLKRTGIFGDFFAEPDRFNASSDLSRIEKQQFDFVLVCTKSSDSLAAAQDLSQNKLISSEKTAIILCQNGWSNAETFARFFPKKKVYNARVITGFERPRKNHVNITVHADAVHLGTLFDSDLKILEPLAQAISSGDLPCIVTEHIEKDLWAKMLYNCALNPLGAILDVPYGRLAQLDYTRNIMNAIAEEIFLVLSAAGRKTHWSTPQEFLKVFYEKLVPDTAEHRSSTLQDLNAKKKTEIEALNGAVIKLAEEYKIPVPTNRTIYNIIKFIENR